MLSALGLEVKRGEVGEKCGSNGFNLYAFLPGDGEPLLLSAHLDTVSPGAEKFVTFCSLFVYDELFYHIKAMLSISIM